jgi:aminoglycoside phosphotransferase (APT) family kinase protein
MAMVPLRGVKGAYPMPSLETAAALEGDVRKIPAVQAWRRLQPAEIPTEVRRKERSKKRVEIYWLLGVGGGGGSVIAKRVKRPVAELEALVYRELLPTLPMPTLRYHGLVDAEDGHCWVFIEYAAGERYSPLRSEHRRTAGRWIALVHHGLADGRFSAALPDRGLPHHLRRLHAVRQTVFEESTDPAFGRGGARVLHRLARLLDTMDSHWSELGSLCAMLPPTLVHGDFVRKNLRIRAADGDRLSLIAFDWGNAGWGPPAVDLGQVEDTARLAANPCLEAYRSAIHASGGSLDQETLEIQAAAGTLLRSLSAVYWHRSRLSFDMDPELSLARQCLGYMERAWERLGRGVGGWV